VAPRVPGLEPGRGASAASVRRVPPRDVPAEAISDLVGALAYGELTAFTRLAADARLAPTLRDEVALAGYAARRFRDFRTLADHLTALGLDPELAMSPFVAPLDAFHDKTEPSDFLEGLVKAFVGDGIARDFYREVADLLTAAAEAPTRALLLEVLVEPRGAADYVIATVRAAMRTDRAVGGRLALWGRRLVGEALAQTQHAAAERDALIQLISERGDLTDLVGLLSRVTQAHTARMDALGLSG